MRKYSFEILCPHCKTPLNDSETHVNGIPGIKFLVRVGKKQGFLWVSAYYGDHATIEPEELDIRRGELVEIFCPHCHKPLPVKENCFCKGSVILVDIDGGGQIEFCNRKGCHYHQLRFSEPEDFDRFLGIITDGK